MVRAWLIHSMQNLIRKTYLPIVKDIWDAIREAYSDDVSYIFEIKIKLWQLKQGNCEVIDFYMEMVTL